MGWWHGAVCLSITAAVVRWAPRLPALRLLPWLILGYLNAHWQMSLALDDRLPLCADATIRQFELVVLDPPVRSPTSGSDGSQIARFQARVHIPPGTECLAPGSYRVRLSWYEPPDLAAGERWLVEGRLRPPWGNLNPGGFDYERWLLGQGLAGTGYVRSGTRLAPATGCELLVA